MNEENTTIMPPEKQIVQDDRDARAEELESAFSYDGYQVVRKELFAHLRDPAIVIRKDSITFNTACITGLEDVVYVHVMFNNDLKTVIRPSSSQKLMPSPACCSVFCSVFCILLTSHKWTDPPLVQPVN